MGGAAVVFFARMGFDVLGIDNDMRAKFFGSSGSTSPNTKRLEGTFPNFTSFDIDIRNIEGIRNIFAKYGRDLEAVIHCAAQPSHDWAATQPQVDFSINANGTLNLLEATREFAPDAKFVFMSSNKVYGDKPNQIPYVETETRWTPESDSTWSKGFDESLTIDASSHSLFGVSKASADLLVQEYGRYFGMATACFRGGCLTGPDHAGVELHGFLSYLIKCVVHRRPYTVFGHKGKQVRDNIHTDDLVQAFWEFIQKPSPGAVYNIGGSTFANVSIIEAIHLAESFSGQQLEWSVESSSRFGDHIWYVSDVSRFLGDYPNWRVTRGLEDIVSEMVAREEVSKHL